ncbi:MAG: (2Fe-2S)-binding protein, partial [Rhodospirillales bacterium]
MRVPAPGIVAATDPVEIRFDGAPLEARPGEMLAAALTAAGHLDVRDTRRGGRRGVFCGMGACQDCLVTVDGVPDQRACMTPVVPGMTVRRQGVGGPPGPAAAPAA